MKNRSSISGVEVTADSDFIVYGPLKGIVAECDDLPDARRILDQKRSEAIERNKVPDLTIFRWSSGHWVPAVTLYDLQEIDLAKNPGRVIRFP
jgi:hypothetical protein